MTVEQVALDAVSALVHEIDPGAMVQRFVLVAEVVDADGHRILWELVPPGAKAWDTLGLLGFALTREMAE